MAIDKAVFYGGAVHPTAPVSGTYQMDYGYFRSRVQIIDGAVGLVMKLPDASLSRIDDAIPAQLGVPYVTPIRKNGYTTGRKGGPNFYIVNVGSNNITLQDFDGTPVHSSITPIEPNKVVTVGLANNLSSAGVWFLLKMDLAS